MAIAQSTQHASPPPAPRTSWLAAQPIDWALSALYLCVVGVYAIQTLLPGAPPFSLPGALVLGPATFALLAIDRWEYWRYSAMPPKRIALALLLLRAGLVELINMVDKNGASAFLYLILPFTATLALGPKLGWGVGALVWLRFIAHLGWPAESWHLQEHVLQNAIAFPAGVAFVMAMGQLVKIERGARIRTERLLDELEESHARLSDYASQVEALTVTAERNRVARDIHDSLGHYLTAINVQIRKASAFRAKDPGEAAQALDDALRLSHNALDDVRRSVGMLRSGTGAFEIRRDLQELAAPLRGGGLAIDLRIDGSEEGFPPAALMALYRGAQEGLTNVQRHARAGRVQLTLRFDADMATLTVADDGAGFDAAAYQCASPERAHGYGLLGIHERMELVGGSADIASAPGAGTTLTLAVPKLRPDQVRRARAAAEMAQEEGRCW